MGEALETMRQAADGLSGDHFWRLVERFRADLVHQAFSMLGKREDAEDVAQESLCEAFESLHKLKDPKKIGNWLRQINRRNAIDFKRHKQRVREEKLPTAAMKDLVKLPGRAAPFAPQGTGSSGKEIEDQDVLKAVENLPEVFREVLILRFMEGMSGEEIAQFLGIPPATVRTRIFRAEAHLMRKLGFVKSSSGRMDKGRRREG
jgi:RNA polymerase sigma-70 factor (ECF subfamily)